MVIAVSGARGEAGRPPPATRAPEVPQLALPGHGGIHVLAEEPWLDLGIQTWSAAPVAGLMIHADGEDRYWTWTTPTVAELGGGSGQIRDWRLRLELDPSVSAVQCLQMAVHDELGRVSPYRKLCLVRRKHGGPVANAGADLTVYEGEAVQLTGDLRLIGQSLQTVRWRMKDAPDKVRLHNPASVSPSFTAPRVDAPTTLTLEMMVQDMAGGRATDTLRVTVLDTHQSARPVVDAGMDLTVQSGRQSVALTGRVTDLDSAVSVYWMVDDPSVQLQDHQRLRTLFDAPRVDVPTLLTFMLVAADGHHQQRDTVLVRVEPPAARHH